MGEFLEYRAGVRLGGARWWAKVVILGLLFALLAAGVVVPAILRLP